MKYIEAIESALNIKAKIELLPMQAGDVPSNCADISRAMQDFNFQPKIDVNEGVRNFISWYRDFYKK